jgi:hypothetical protein
VASPARVLNANGIENKHGYITEYVTLQVKIDEHSEKLDFAVTQLNTANDYLGLEWLKQHNPFVNWRTGQMRFNNCPKECQRHPMRMAKVDEVRIDGLSHDQEHFEAMNMQVQVEKSKYFYKPIKTGMFEEVVPKHYHNFKDVFGEEEFQALPEQRTWDHAIELEEGFKPTRGLTYSLNRRQEEEMNKFVDENLRSGRIRPLKSPQSSPFFFVKKKGDMKSRPTQDYQKLNDSTRNNCYPLPLIGELINRLKKSKVLSKMDIWWGYNNIRIKEGNKWKAVFHTSSGLYELTVMFFGLCNSPVTFQAFMNEIFADLIREGVVKM